MPLKWHEILKKYLKGNKMVTPISQELKAIFTEKDRRPSTVFVNQRKNHVHVKVSCTQNKKNDERARKYAKQNKITEFGRTKTWGYFSGYYFHVAKGRELVTAVNKSDLMLNPIVKEYKRKNFKVEFIVVDNVTIAISPAKSDVSVLSMNKKYFKAFKEIINNFNLD